MRRSLCFLLHGLLILATVFSVFSQATDGEVSEDTYEEDLAQQCMMALLGPEDTLYDGKLPTFEIQISRTCPCDHGSHEIEIRVSREMNKRTLNITTNMSCTQLYGDGAYLDLLDLRDGHWEGYVSVNSLSLSQNVRFSYVTAFNPRIEVLLPIPGYVYGPKVDPVIVIHVCDVTVPVEPLLGIEVEMTVNGEKMGKTKNPGRDKYIHLRTADGQYFRDGRYNITLQTVDIIGRAKGDPAHTEVVIDRTIPPDAPFEAPLSLGGPRLPPEGAHTGGWCPERDGEQLCPNCGAHGRCSGFACECDPDWIGSRCQHHLLGHTHYLPPEMPDAAPLRCEETLVWDAVVQELSGAVNRLQNPPDCYDPNLRVVTDVERHPLALGHGLRWEALVLGDSLVNGTAYLPGATWALFDFGNCVGKGLWCYFHAPSRCNATDVDPFFASQTPLRVTHVTRKWPLPAEAGGRVGLFQWSVVMIGLVMQPRPSLNAMVQRLKSVVGYRHPIIGVHIRYGDGCLPNQMHRPPCEPITTYLDEIRRAAHKYNISRVWVASDDAQAVWTLRAMSGLEVLNMPLDRSVYDSAWWIDHRAAFGLVDRRQIAESALLDVMLLAHADVLVGSFSSHFSSAAFELSTHLKGYIPPYISVDCPWKPVRPLGHLQTLPTCQDRVVSISDL